MTEKKHVRVSVYMPVELMEKIEKESKRQNRSRSQQMVYLIQKHLDRVDNSINK